MNRAYTLSEVLTYGKGVERNFLCPVHGDSRPSAYVNMVKKVWYCQACGAHGGLTGEAACVEPDYEQMKRWFSEKMEEHRVFPESWLSRWDAGGVHPYWRARVGDEAARHFRLGYDPDAGAVTYPLRGTGGEVLGVVRRSLDGSEEGPKYRYPRGVDVGGLLFNYSPVSRPFVVLCEGALDAIALWNVGVEAFAIYGSRLSRAQVALIERVDPDRIYTAYDNDDAGYRAHLATEQAFRHRLVSRLSWPRSWGKDVDEIGKIRLEKLVSSLVSPDLSCVGSVTCESSPTRSSRPRILSSATTSTRSVRPRRLRIV